MQYYQFSIDQMEGILFWILPFLQRLQFNEHNYSAVTISNPFFFVDISNPSKMSENGSIATCKINILRHEMGMSIGLACPMTRQFSHFPV